MDPFAAVLLFALIAFIVIIWLLGRYYPGSGLEQLGLRSAREITETRERLEAEDLDQMVSARNRRRAARGERPVSAEELERDLAAERERHRGDRNG